jgi:hypothetical protein
MKKRFTVKSITKFVVFDTKTRTVLKGEYTSVQSADDDCRRRNIDDGYIEAASRAEDRA